MLQAVIFDMDGLIVDSEPLESKALEILLGKYGINPVYYDNGLLHIPGGEASYHTFLTKYKIAEEEQVVVRKKRRIFTSLIKEIKPTEGFLPLIQTLKNRKIKTGLASNRNRRHIRLMIEAMLVKDFFDVVVGPSIKLRHKPNPDIYLHTAKRLKVGAESCLVLEDTERGVLAGKAAGMKVVAIPNRYTKDQDLSKADLIVDSLEDIKWGTISKL